MPPNYGTPVVPTSQLQAPVHTLKAVPMPYSAAKGAQGGRIYEVQEITSATDLTPTQQGEYLTGLWVSGGGAGGAGAFGYTYDGIHQAIFPSPASGLDATGAIGPEFGMFYPMNVGPVGTKLPSGSQAFLGGLARVMAFFSNGQNPSGKTFPDWRGVFVSGNESGTSGTSKTYSIPGPLAKPTGITGLASIQAGTATGIPLARILFPSVGSYAAYSVPAELSRYGVHPRIWPVPDYDAASSFALTHKALSLGGATDVQIAGCLWY